MEAREPGRTRATTTAAGTTILYRLLDADMASAAPHALTYPTLTTTHEEVLQPIPIHK